MTAITKTSPVIFYRGYSIEKDSSGMYPGWFMYYPTEQGVQHDADMDGEDYHYCGNCGWASDLDQVKDEIWEKVATEWPTYYKVETIIKLGGYRLRNITKFAWLSDAMTFAEQTNGYLDMSFLNPVNP